MKKRILAALVGMPLALAALFASGPLDYGLIVLALALVALHEYLMLCGVERLLLAGVLGGAAPLLVAVPLGRGPAAAAAVLPVLALLALWRVDDPARRRRRSRPRCPTGRR